MVRIMNRLNDWHDINMKPMNLLINNINGKKANKINQLIINNKDVNWAYCFVLLKSINKNGIDVERSGAEWNELIEGLALLIQ